MEISRRNVIEKNGVEHVYTRIAKDRVQLMNYLSRTIMARVFSAAVLLPWHSSARDTYRKANIVAGRVTYLWILRMQIQICTDRISMSNCTDNEPRVYAIALVRDSIRTTLRCQRKLMRAVVYLRAFLSHKIWSVRYSNLSGKFNVEVIMTLLPNAHFVWRTYQKV